MLQRVLLGKKEALRPESYDIQVSLSNMAFHAEQGSWTRRKIYTRQFLPYKS
jgi:hypothetical protein